MEIPFIDESFLDKIKEYVALFDEAEQGLKQSEMFSEIGVITPAINELRYTAKHIATALCKQDANVSNKCLDEAIIHAKRAIYDVYDAQIMFFVQMYHGFQNDYKDIPITEEIQNYNALNQEIKSIINSIGKENRENKEIYVDEKRKQLDRIKDIYENCVSARDELNKRVRSVSKSTAWNRFFVLLAIISLIIAVASWLKPIK
jgi:hypothetical protein